MYCHDVEFVSPAEVLGAITELRQIRDTEHTIKYIGISGYPVPLLCELAELVLKETGEPLDAVMSYANFTLQNTTLLSLGLERLRKAGVQVVPNASPLGMGLLRGVGVPVGGQGDFHPAPQGLREAVGNCARFVEMKSERLEAVAIRWGLETWAREGADVGGVGPNGEKVGISVMGCSNLRELDETITVWRSVVDGLDGATHAAEKEKREWSLKRSKQVQDLALGVQDILGSWKDYAWASPDEGYVNVRNMKK